MLEAYGGLERWQAAERVLVVFSAGGLVPAAGLRPAGLRSVGAMVATTTPPRVVLDGFPTTGRRGVLDGAGARIVAAAGGGAAPSGATSVPSGPGDAGTVPSGPGDAGTVPSGPGDAARRWDDLRLLRFAAAAAWRDLALPFVLTHPDVDVREPRPGSGGRRLAVRLPPGWGMGEGELVLHVDGAGRIRRVDHTLPIGGRSVEVAERCEGHCDFDGLLVATRRRAHLRVGPAVARPGPRLWWVDVLTAMAGPRPGGSRPGGSG